MAPPTGEVLVQFHRGGVSRLKCLLYSRPRSILFRSKASPNIDFKLPNYSLSQGDRYGTDLFGAAQGPSLFAANALVQEWISEDPITRNAICIAQSDNIQICATDPNIARAMYAYVRAGAKWVLHLASTRSR